MNTATVDSHRPPSARASYRPDVDGLRAVAILLVLAFHAIPEWLPGGFVGVDVFFVISGYLITGIVASGVVQERFTFGDFYARRVLRIFPSLAVVLLACLFAGWYLLLPDEYAQLGKHVFAGAGFVSNLALWRESGYFDNAAETKPLLHLWSLGIEEQFYFLWPALVFLLLRRARSAVRATIGIAGLSFAVGLALLRFDASAAFYFPLSRFWELLIGAALALRRDIPSALSSPSLRETRIPLSVLGAVLILVGAVFFDATTPFPGVAGLAPTIGAALLIASAESAAFNRFLGTRLMVGIGLISFPLYLWHWPLLSFARIVNGGTPSLPVRLGLLALAFIAAALTYVLVEKPIRFGSRRRTAVAGLSLAMIGIAGIGVVILWRDGIPSRLPRAVILSDALPRRETSAGCAPQFQNLPGRSGSCRALRAGPTDSVIWGDSHAFHLFPGLTADASRNWMVLVQNGCPPVSGIDVVMNVGSCQAASEKALAALASTREVSTVVLSFSSTYASDSIFAADHIARNGNVATVSSAIFDGNDKLMLLAKGIERVVSTLEASGKRVLIFLDTPELPFFPRDCIRRELISFGARGGCSLSVDVVRERQRPYREVVRRVQEAHPSLAAFDPVESMCDDRECHYRNGETLLYFDSHHLSRKGSAWIGAKFLGWMDQVTAHEDGRAPDRLPRP